MLLHPEAGIGGPPGIENCFLASQRLPPSEKPVTLGLGLREAAVSTPRIGFETNFSMGWVAARVPPKRGPDLPRIELHLFPRRSCPWIVRVDSAWATLRRTLQEPAKIPGSSESLRCRARDLGM